MKKNILKYAEPIFWIIVALDFLGILRGNFFGIIGSILLIISYFLFKKTKENRWFLTYFLSFFLSGIAYFLYVGFITGNFFPRIASIVVFATGMYADYKFVYLPKKNKKIAWILYFVIIILSIFIGGLFKSF